MLLVEPWWAGSHRAWAEGLVAHSRHRFEVLADQPTGWKATVDQAAERLASRVVDRPDVVLASSLLDLEAFLTRSSLDDVPAVLYMHENQLTYDRTRPDLVRGRVNWKAVRRADVVAFNSQFHLEDFFGALPILGVKASAAAIPRASSRVLPVGIEAEEFAGDAGGTAEPPVIVWNHRWETDKDPDGFLAALEAIIDLPWQLILLGEGAGSDRFRARAERFTARAMHVGHAARSTYAGLLRRSDVVVSTARQEFFGVSVVEAMAAGVVPVVPDRLAYPEVLGSGLAECLYAEGELADALGAAITDPSRIERLRPVARETAAQFDWKSIVGRYDELIDSMV